LATSIGRQGACARKEARERQSRETREASAGCRAGHCGDQADIDQAIADVFAADRD